MMAMFRIVAFVADSGILVSMYTLLHLLKPILQLMCEDI
jgi:hypothetical protein